MEMVPDRRRFAMVGLILILFLSTGCWDRVEPEERGYVIAAAIDEPGKKESGLYKITYQFVNTSQMGSNSGGKSGGAGSSPSQGVKSFFNMSGTADTIEEFNQKLTSRTSRTPYFQHLMLIIISAKVAKNAKKYGDVLDFYISNEEMRRTNKVIIAENNNAAKILNVQHPAEQLPALYLRSIAENTRTSMRLVPATLIGDIQMFLLKNDSYAIQKVTSKKRNEATISGAAVFSGKTNKLAGYLDDMETQGLNLIKGKPHMGVLQLKVKGEKVNFRIIGIHSSIKAYWHGNRDIRFTVHIHAEGDITEKYGKIDLSKKKVINELQEAAEQRVVYLAQSAVERIQKQFKCDPAGFGRQLRKKHFREWQRIKKQWDGEGGYFMDSKITITSDVTVRRTGLANKTE